MTAKLTTREKLLLNARRLFWAEGYSNVPLRQVAKAAGVDVALISRHFGSKQGLFEASIEGAFALPALNVDTPAQLIDALVALYMQAHTDNADPTPLQMLLRNADDPEVAGLTRQAFIDQFYQDYARIFADPTRAALFMSALLGFSVAKKSLDLPGLAATGTPEYGAQLRHLLTTALAYPQSTDP